MISRRAAWTRLMLVTFGIGSHVSWSMSSSGPELRRTSSGRRACRLHLARAHSRMENTMCSARTDETASESALDFSGLSSRLSRVWGMRPGRWFR